MAKSERVRLDANNEVDLNGHQDIIKKLDTMRGKEITGGLSRAAMTRIAIDEAYKARFGKKKK